MDTNRPVFRRVIDIYTLIQQGTGRSRVALEDDYHHFRVDLEYHNHQVISARGEALRIPYTLCANATTQLNALNGMPLSPDANAINRYTDPSRQCTHMFDEAGLAIAAAARNISQRRYRIEVPRHMDLRTTAQLWRDDQLLLTWDIHDYTILGPEPFKQLPLGRGFSRWIQDQLDDDMAEAALVLRRCAMISQGRLHNQDIEKHAKPVGTCYSQQPERAEQALRVVGSTIDFTTREGELCDSDKEWLQQLS